MYLAIQSLTPLSSPYVIFLLKSLPCDEDMIDETRYSLKMSKRYAFDYLGMGRGIF